jgi:hypothetical protein
MWINDASPLALQFTQFQEKVTALHAAAMNGQVGSLSYLLSKGAPIEAKDASGETALVKAICFCEQHLDSCFALLKAGASLQALDKHGDSVWDHLLKMSNSDTAQQRPWELANLYSILRSFGQPECFDAFLARIPAVFDERHFDMLVRIEEAHSSPALILQRAERLGVLGGPDSRISRLPTDLIHMVLAYVPHMGIYMGRNQLGYHETIAAAHKAERCDGGIALAPWESQFWRGDDDEDGDEVGEDSDYDDFADY